MTDPLRDPVGAAAERDAALEQVASNADEAWMEAAYAAVEHLALLRKTFTADDVWLHLRDVAQVDPPREPRALGAVFTRAAAMEIIERTPQWTESARRACHRRPLRIWRSLVCVEAS